MSSMNNDRKRRYVKRMIVFGLPIIILLGGILKFNAAGRNNYLNKLNNRNLIFEGQIDHVLARMRMYKEDSIIYADLVLLGSAEEIALKGLYYRANGQISLKNKEKDVSMRLFMSKKENDAYIGKLKLHGVSGNVSIHLCLAYAEMFPGDIARSTMYDSLGYDTKKVDETVNMLLKYIKEEKRELVAGLIQYPLTVTTDDESFIVENKEEFVTKYGKIIDDTIIHGAENEFSAFWMADSDHIGIMNGRGRLCKTADGEIKVTAIDNNHIY